MTKLLILSVVVMLFTFGCESSRYIQTTPAATKAQREAYDARLKQREEERQYYRDRQQLIDDAIKANPNIFKPNPKKKE